jgi:hypothetical protein
MSDLHDNQNELDDSDLTSVTGGALPGGGSGTGGDGAGGGGAGVGIADPANVGGQQPPINPPSSGFAPG